MRKGRGGAGGYRGNTEKKSREGRVGIGQGSRGQLLINVPLLTSFLSCYVPAGLERLFELDFFWGGGCGFCKSEEINSWCRCLIEPIQIYSQFSSGITISLFFFVFTLTHSFGQLPFCRHTHLPPPPFSSPAIKTQLFWGGADENMQSKRGVENTGRLSLSLSLC